MTRYDMDWGYDGNGAYYATEGDWVKYEDAEKLEEALKEINSQEQELEDLITTCTDIRIQDMLIHIQKIAQEALQ
jgi:hypothetical protein